MSESQISIGELHDLSARLPNRKARYPFRVEIQTSNHTKDHGEEVRRYVVWDNTANAPVAGHRSFLSRRRAQEIVDKLNLPTRQEQRRTTDYSRIEVGGKKVGHRAYAVYCILREQHRARLSDQQIIFLLVEQVRLRGEKAEDPEGHWKRQLPKYFRLFNKGKLPGQEGPPKPGEEAHPAIWYTGKKRRPKGWRSQTTAKEPTPCPNVANTPTERG